MLSLSQLIGQRLPYGAIVKRYSMHVFRKRGDSLFKLTILLSDLRVIEDPWRNIPIPIKDHVWVEPFKNPVLLQYVPHDLAVFRATAYQYTRRNGSTGFSDLARYELTDLSLEGGTVLRVLTAPKDRKDDDKHDPLSEFQVQHLRQGFKWFTDEQLELMAPYLVQASYHELCRLIRRSARRRTTRKKRIN
jgi:hypothetical protein